MRGGAAVFASGREVLRNGDVHYEFRQTSNFHYLTGFDEPDSVAVLRPGHEQPYVIFVRPRDPEMEIWVGPRAGVDGAVKDFGADAAYPIEELDTRLPQLLVEAEHGLLLARLRRAHRAAGLARPSAVAAQAPNAVAEIVDPAPLVAAMRLIKSADEIDVDARAIDVTAAGIEAAMRDTRPGMHEYEVQAVLEGEFRRLGSPAQRLPLDRRDRRERLHPPLRHEPRPHRGRRPAADRRRRGVGPLQRRHQPDMASERALLEAAARRLRHRAGGAGSRHRCDAARRRR